MRIVEYKYGYIIFNQNEIVLVSYTWKIYSLNKFFLKNNKAKLVKFRPGFKISWIKYFVFSVEKINNIKNDTPLYINFNSIIVESLINNKKIINYFKKKIEFCTYDYTYGEITSKHIIETVEIIYEKEIHIKFDIKDAIIAVWIAFIKINSIENTKAYLIHDNKINITDWEEFTTLFYIANNDIKYNTIIINSENDLTNEKNIITYCNTNDKYEDYYLYQIIKKTHKLPFV